MIESWIKDLGFLAPYLKEKLETDDEHTWETAPYIPDDLKKLIREKKPSTNYSPAYCPTFQPLNYQAQNISANMRQTQESIASQQTQSIESERNALLFSVAQQQQNERIRNSICNTGYTMPPAYYPYSLYNPCSQYYPFC